MAPHSAPKSGKTAPDSTKIPDFINLLPIHRCESVAFNLWGYFKMNRFAAFSLCAVVLSGCAVASGNNTGFLDNGNDVSFLQNGVNSCPGIAAASGNDIYERYPLRCGPQAR